MTPQTTDRGLPLSYSLAGPCGTAGSPILHTHHEEVVPESDTPGVVADAVNRSARLAVLLVMRTLWHATTVSALFLAAACGSSVDDAAPSPVPASSGETGGASGAVLPEGEPYVVSDYAFEALVVAPGQVVEVIDEDGEPHTLTATDGAFDTGSFDGNSPGMFTAPVEPGTYEFTCEIHPTMTGTLTVK